MFGVYYLFLFSFISYTFIFKAWSFCDFLSETLVLIPKWKVIALYLFVLVRGIITLMFTTAFKKFAQTFAACLCQHWKPIFQIATPLGEHYFKIVYRKGFLIKAIVNFWKWNKCVSISQTFWKPWGLLIKLSSM